MKPALLVMLLLGLTAVAAAEPAPAAPRTTATTDTLAAVRERGTLRACVAPYAPWVMHQPDGSLRGYSVDLAKQLAGDLGVEIEFVLAGYPEVIPILVEGQCDVIPSGLSPTPERALFVHFSGVTALHEIVMVADKTTAAGWKKPEDLNAPDLAVGAVAASAELVDARRAFPNAKIQEFPSQAEMAAALLEGKIPAVVAANPLPALFLKLGPDRFVTPLQRPIALRGEAFAVRRGDLEFLAYLNTWVQAHVYDGWLGDRARYWFKTLEWVDQERR